MSDSERQTQNVFFHTKSRLQRRHESRKANTGDKGDCEAGK